MRLFSNPAIMIQWLFALRPNDVTWRRRSPSTLIRVMVCCLEASICYLNQYWNSVNWTLKNKLQWNFNQIPYIFLHENILGNVECKMWAILFRSQCVIVTVHTLPWGIRRLISTISGAAVYSHVFLHVMDWYLNDKSCVYQFTTSVLKFWIPGITLNYLVYIYGKFQRENLYAFT